MQTRTVFGAAAAAVIALSLACGSSPAAPTTDTPPNPTPKLTAPTVQSPSDGQTTASLTPMLTAGPATVDLSGYQLQYRFQVFNDADTLVADSGLVGEPSWTPGSALTPNKRYTWKVRAESQGWPGPWSSVVSFLTPDPPPTYRGSIGNWQACAGLYQYELVACVWNTIKPADAVGDFEVVKRVAWLARGEGAGLLIKNDGENVIRWQGYSFSATRVCYSDGHIYKIISDAGPGGTNGPQWADDDFVDLDRYVPAIDPGKP